MSYICRAFAGLVETTTKIKKKKARKDHISSPEFTTCAFFLVYRLDNSMVDWEIFRRDTMTNQNEKQTLETPDLNPKD